MSALCRLLGVLYISTGITLVGCQSTESGYDWSPGDEIQTNSSGEVVAPDAIVLPEEDIEAINKL